MKEKYSDGAGFKKELAKKKRNDNRKIRQTYSRASYDSTKDKPEDLDEWYELDDDEFEKFRNGKR
tara:strand:- start:6453 stop:6647 length:195 start_codon:yes stop_codon:yes gene_type:complete